MANSFLSRIIIIQSLGVDEPPTGRQLRDAIESIAKFNHGVAVELIEARSARDVLKAIDDIQVDVEITKSYPVLHIECHGLADKSGLFMGDESTLTWAELKPALVKLNQTTRCHLLVTLAACHGGYLVDTLDVSLRAPCWGILGPSDAVSSVDLVSSYSAFFLDLLESGNPNTAFTSLKNAPMSTGHYFFRTAEENFKEVFQLYRAAEKVERDDRLKRFSASFKRHGPLSEDWVSNALNDSEQDNLKQFYRQYFFVDMFPENQQRFIDGYLALAR
ncbi:MAG: hypothetical protein V4858_23190 [Pseudomonadota bacterium]